jgi:hypothetical protein
MSVASSALQLSFRSFMPWAVCIAWAVGLFPCTRSDIVAPPSPGNAAKKEGQMRRLLVILAAFVALAVPISAQAATTVERITFDSTFPLCNGDLIHVTGPLLAVMTETATPSGGEVFSFQFNPQGVTGVDLVTGTVFHATGLTRDLAVYSPPGGFTETFVNRFHIQSTGGAESYIITELFHITVTPDGTVRVSVDNFASTC